MTERLHKGIGGRACIRQWNGHRGERTKAHAFSTLGDHHMQSTDTFMKFSSTPPDRSTHTRTNRRCDRREAVGFGELKVDERGTKSLLENHPILDTDAISGAAQHEHSAHRQRTTANTAARTKSTRGGLNHNSINTCARTNQRTTA